MPFQQLPQPVQSPNDQRKYKAIRLENDLEVILISDEDCDKSSAVMSVNVGQLEDPQERQGIAHFLEHMLFQGTKKYPNETDFNDYLDKNSGMSNAYTDLLETVYYFECSNQGYEGAVDRFSRFFYESLFDPNSTEREMKAVDSEHQKNLQQDMWRSMQLMRYLSHKENAFNKFGTGDLTTLKHDTIRDDLLNFYDTYYSANLMKLALTSNQSIEELEKMAVHCFSTIRNKGIDRQKYSDMPFTKENLQKMVYQYPINDKNALEIYFITEQQNQYYKNSPSDYYSFVIGHEGKNSLDSKLKEENLIFYSYCYKTDQMNLFGEFVIHFSLTQKGLDNLDRVIQILGTFLNQLKVKGPQKYLKDEMNVIREIQFQNLDKQKGTHYLITLASRMKDHDIQDIIKTHYLQGEFDKEALQNYINQLSIDKAILKLQSKSIKDKCDQKEPVYGTEYKIEDLDSKIVEYFKNPTHIDGLDYPAPNQFMPKNMELVQSQNLEQLPEVPQEILSQDGISVYFKQDNKFKVPKAAAYLSLYTNDGGFGSNPRSFLLASLWKEIQEWNLANLSYEAEQVQLQSSINVQTIRIEFKFQGYSDSLPKYMKLFFEELSSFKASKYEAQFQTNLEKMIEKYTNHPNSDPYQQVYQMVSHSLVNNQYEPSELLEIANSLTFEEFQAFSDQWLKNVYQEWLIQGNLTKQQALEFQSIVGDVLAKEINTKIMKKNQIQDIRTIQVRNDQPFFINRNLPPQQNNSAISYVYQFGKLPDKQYLLLKVLEKIVKSPFFDEIRTRQALGYVVFTVNQRLFQIDSLVFLIQSDVIGAHAQAQRIEKFLEDFQENINKLTEEDLDKFKHSVEVDLKKKYDSIAAETTKNWFYIIDHSFRFKHSEELVDLLPQITLQDIQEFYKINLMQQPCKLELMLSCDAHKESEVKALQERQSKNQDLKQAQSIAWLKKVSNLYPNYNAKL